MKSTHKDLIVWQKSIILVKRIYQVTRCFPHEELMGISSQMRRAAISIPSNIAEGYGRGTTKELLHLLYIALGSASELDTQIILCKELGFIIDLEAYQELYQLNIEVLKMLTALIKSQQQ